MSPRKGAYPQFFVTAETKFTALSSHSPYYLQGTGYKLAIIAAIMLGHGCPNKRERREREREIHFNSTQEAGCEEQARLDRDHSKHLDELNPLPLTNRFGY